MNVKLRLLILTAVLSTAYQPGVIAMEQCNEKLLGRLLEVIETELIPMTRKTVAEGNKVFGAAMLNKSDLSTIIAASNHETENPLWHGEVYTIKQYYDLVNTDETKRVNPKDVIFLATHEPCPLCLSAITWGGYDNFYYLFSHEDSRDSFKIGHDLKILKQVFKHDPGGYARSNDYWSSYRIADLVNTCDQATQSRFNARIDDIKKAYSEISAVYQANKDKIKNIPLK